METIKLQHPNIKKCECSISIDGKLIDSNNEYCLCTICRFSKYVRMIDHSNPLGKCKVKLKSQACKENKCPCKFHFEDNSDKLFKKCEPITKCTSYKYKGE